MYLHIFGKISEFFVSAIKFTFTAAEKSCFFGHDHVRTHTAHAKALHAPACCTQVMHVHIIHPIYFACSLHAQ